MTMNKPTLVYIADPMCSWCWGFSPVMETIHAAFSADLNVQVLMGGLRPGTREPMTADLRADILHHWREVHRRTGQPFQFEGAMPPGFVYNTEPACRAVVVVSEIAPARTFSYLKRVQAAFYSALQDVTQFDVLLELAGEEGISPKVFSSTFHSDTLKQKTQAQFIKTQDLGVGGFPTVIMQHEVGSTVLSRGYRSLETLRAALEDWWSKYLVVSD